jgi:hypothetical protein
MKDGKAAGIETSGTTVFKFASGTLAAILGKDRQVRLEAHRHRPLRNRVQRIG